MTLTENVWLKINKEMREGIRARSEELGISMSNVMRLYIQRGLSQDKLDGRLVDQLRALRGEKDGDDQ